MNILTGSSKVLMDVSVILLCILKCCNSYRDGPCHPIPKMGIFVSVYKSATVCHLLVHTTEVVQCCMN